MSDDTARRGRGTQLRRVVVLAALAALAYPVSLGPACWGLSWFQLEVSDTSVAYAVSVAYCPLGPVVVDGPEPVRRGLKWWMAVGMPARTEFHGDWHRGLGWSNPGYTYTLWYN